MFNLTFICDPLPPLPSCIHWSSRIQQSTNRVAFSSDLWLNILTMTYSVTVLRPHCEFVNYDLEGMSKEVVVAWFEVLGICLERLRKTTKNVIRDSRSPGPDSNPGHLEYATGGIMTVPRRSVKKCEGFELETRESVREQPVVRVFSNRGSGQN
jgi:hypothetical protein